MVFSSRTSWHREPNRLSELLEKLRADGTSILDLTLSNPTACGFQYPEKEILSAISGHESLQYHPDPKGILSARIAIAQYYKEKSVDVSPENIFLTASTSEAYSFIFKLLCNPNDEMLVPSPSYPLFDFLAQVNDVELRNYHLAYDHGWQIDFDSVETSITQKTKGIFIVNPNNPTGQFLKKHESERLNQIARANNLALIVDEVFAEYAFAKDENRVETTAGNTQVLTFTLNGISKLLGLPQMKLGWIAVSGEQQAVREVRNRLEILCDTFLSVNTPVQVALPELLTTCTIVRQQIHHRVTLNYTTLHKLTADNSPLTVLHSEGGWYALLQLPGTNSDETWAIELLEKKGVYVHPGYFYDFHNGTFLVVSLLVEPQTFMNGITAIASHVQSNS